MSMPTMYQGREHELSKARPEHLEDQEDPEQLNSYGQPAQYGSTIIKQPYLQWRRRRLNVVAIVICLFVPWLFFCFMFWLTSFKLFYRHPAMVVLLGFLALVFVILLGLKATEAVKKGGRSNDQHSESTWYVFLFVTCLIAWALGIYVGYHNFYYRMDVFYGIENLGSYANVDPATTPGQQLMDGGRVVFKTGTHIDLSKSMSFRNNDVYCVAPIVGANNSLTGAPESYDFWAVGLNCCCGESLNAADFQCGEYKNAQATAGLRLMRDEQRPFYRLAVQQAVSTYGIRASHPLFFEWVQDPISAADAYKWDGHRQYLIGVYLHFAFQIICVGLTTLACSQG